MNTTKRGAFCGRCIAGRVVALAAAFNFFSASFEPIDFRSDRSNEKLAIDGWRTDHKTPPASIDCRYLATVLCCSFVSLFFFLAQLALYQAGKHSLL
jgi:hypothetical protein